MELLFTLCGRAGSKGIRNKNVKDFLGKPLPFYSLSAVDLFLKKAADIRADILLNTDSGRLMELMEANPFKRPIRIVKRRPELAGDTVSKISVIRNCLENAMEEGNRYDVVVDLDITSPLRTVLDIDRLIRMQDSGIYDVTFSVTQARRNPYFNMVEKKDAFIRRVISSDVNARQAAPQVYDMNASLYAYAPDFLKQKKEIFDGRCGIIEMMDTGILDLDHEGDLELMEVIAKYLFKKYPEYREIVDNI